MVGKSGVRFVLGVWGDWHTRVMVELNFGSMLAPGNIPAFAERYRVIFHIHTRQSERAYIEKSPEYQALKKWCQFEFSFIDELITVDPIAAHKQPWFEGTKKAKERGEYVVFFHPDVAWSDGSFRHIADLLDAGKKVILNGFLRVVDKTFFPVLVVSCKREPTGIIQISSRDLVALGLAHLHPMVAAYDRNSWYYPEHSEMIVWPVPGEGIHARIFAREMFLFDPSCVSYDGNLLLEEAPSEDSVVMIGESDDLFAVSLAPLGKDIRWYETTRRFSPLAIVEWLHLYHSRWNRITASTPINWATTDTNSDRWRRRIWASEVNVKRIRACYLANWVWRMATHLNLCYAAAEIIAYLMSTGLLYKLPDTLPATAIIVPQDSALQPHIDSLYGLLERRNEEVLLGLVMDYIVVDERANTPFNELVSPGDTVSLATLSGRPLKLECKSDGNLFINEGPLYPPTGIPAANLLVYSVGAVVDTFVFEKPESEPADHLAGSVS